MPINDESLSTIYEKNRTSELLSDTMNVDPITNYPVETPQARGKILEILQEAINANKSVIFIDADIDNLKVLNDVLGHKVTNIGIKKVIQEKENVLLNMEETASVLFYRPQAGGDEFKVMLFLSDTSEEENIKQKLWNVLKQDTNFKPEDKANVNIGCSYGITMKKLNGDENPGRLLQEMESQAEERLVGEKMNKITQKLNETIESGTSLDTNAYIELIVSEWGSRRMGNEVLKTILFSVLNKARNEKN